MLAKEQDEKMVEICVFLYFQMRQRWLPVLSRFELPFHSVELLLANQDYLPCISGGTMWQVLTIGTRVIVMGVISRHK